MNTAGALGFRRVAGDREVQILNRVIRWKKQHWIASHIALSASTIKRGKENIVKRTWHERVAECNH